MVRFERESATPNETIAIYYDRRENLAAMGILPPPRDRALGQSESVSGAGRVSFRIRRTLTLRAISSSRRRFVRTTRAPVAPVAPHSHASHTRRAMPAPALAAADATDPATKT